MKKAEKVQFTSENIGGEIVEKESTYQIYEEWRVEDVGNEITYKFNYEETAMIKFCELVTKDAQKLEGVNMTYHTWFIGPNDKPHNHDVDYKYFNLII